MALTVSLKTENNENGSQVIASKGDQILATTLWEMLPGRAVSLANPEQHGPALLAALGGEKLIELLNADRDKLLYLDIAADDPADALAWECAMMPPNAFLVHRYGLLRLVDQDVLLDETAGPLRLIALGADALVDSQGQARDTYRLDILQEMQKIQHTLAQSKKEVSGVRIAPTADALQDALSDGTRSLLHLSCHGSTIRMGSGVEPVLHLEDENGGPAKLLGHDLISLASLADLRLILLSACRVGQAIVEQDAIQGRLTRALVEQGVPAAIGMQGLFPDHLSDDLAAALYRSLLNGQPLGKALQAARLALRQDPTAVGLPVAYVARGGDGPLPLVSGRASYERLHLTQQCHLPLAVQAPEPFLGRNRELYELAKLAQEDRVITIIGTGGMGKTALAAAFARRFGLRYMDGVFGYSFATGEVDSGSFRRALLYHLVGDELADRPQAQQEMMILDTLRTRDLLLLIDNYESVQQARDENEDRPDDSVEPEGLSAQAQAVHGLVRKIASNGGRLLLTSRHQPAGLKGERVFPGMDQLLQGVNVQNGAKLFFETCPRARQERDDPALQQLAREVAQVTAGHPLAIALLGSEYNVGDVPPARFLENWAAELQAAKSNALDDHHATFATAFNRSFDALSAQSQARLQALSVIPFPFFVNGAALLWAITEQEDPEIAQEEEDDDFTATKRDLRTLVNRSLIEVDGYYNDKTPATWRFQPAIQQEAAHRLSAQAHDGYTQQLAHYAAWLSNRTYGDIHEEGNSALARHVQPTLDTLAELADRLTGTTRLWHLRRVGWLLNAFGRVGDAYELLTRILPETALDGEQGADLRPVRSSLLYEIANLEVTRGDLDKALSLYEESLALKEQIGDMKGKAASLHQMAQVYLTRGDLDKALSLYEESLASFEQIGDMKGKAASLHQMAQVYLTRGDLDKALSLYEESLALKEQIGDMKGKAASLHQMAEVYLTRGDLDKALSLYEESLALKEQIGDIQGKAASLHQMAQVYLTRGDLDKALSLYEESLASLEQIGDMKGKAASLHQMAQVYLTRGDLDKALSLYEESLALKEQIGDMKGKAASLSNMAQVYLTRGDLDKALSLYEESLALKEQIGDMKGKAASLSNMAQVYLTRGDLDKALSLYEESLAMDEQIGDIQGKAASLSNMAQVYLTRGDLDKALSLYEESLALKEQIGDMKGKAASLSMMANVYWERGEIAKTQSLMQDAISLRKLVGDMQGTAFDLVKLGQISQRLNQNQEAQVYYQSGLELFQKLGAIREIEQVEGMLASLENKQSTTTTEDDLNAMLAQLSPEERAQREITARRQRAVQQAREAAQGQLWPVAIAHQQEAVAQARKLVAQSEETDAQVQLSVLLYNLASYYQQANRHAEAVTCLEEVVALDELTGHEDLDADRQTLAAARGMTG